MPTPTLWGAQTNLTPTGGAQSGVTTTTLTDGRVVVAWKDDSTASNALLKFEILNVDGTVAQAARTLNQATTGNIGDAFDWQVQVAALSNGGFAAAWNWRGGSTIDTIHYIVYDASGNVVTAETELPRETYTNSQNNLAPAPMTHPTITGTANGDFVIAYEHPDSIVTSNPSLADIRAVSEQLITQSSGYANPTSDGTWAASVFNSSRPSIAYGGGNSADVNVVFQSNVSIFGNIFQFPAPSGVWGSDAGSVYRADANIAVGNGGVGAYDGTTPHIAYSSDFSHYMVVWKANGSIKASLDGNGANVLTVAASNTAQDPKVVGVKGGGFLVIWNDAGSAAVGHTGYDVVGQLYDNAGGTQGSAFVITNGSVINNNIQNLDAAALIDGRVLVTWSAGGPSSNGEDIYSQIIDPRFGPLDWTGTDAAERFIGTQYDDNLVGLGGDDVIWGAAGDDALRGAAGNDTLHGGLGFDVISYWDSHGVVLTLQEGGAGRITMTGIDAALGSDTFDGIEGIDGSEFFADRLTGNSTANRLRGFGGNDTLIGGAGNDTLEGGAADDSINGGAGIDYAYLSGSRADYALRYNGANATISITDQVGGDGADTLAAIEFLHFADQTVATSTLQFLTEADGATSLVVMGGKYRLFANGTTTGPVLNVAGVPLALGGASTPIAAEKTATGYIVAFHNTVSDKFSVWNTNASGTYLSSALSGASATSAGLENIEARFQQDLNLDGVIGINGTVIEGDGSTTLEQLGANYVMVPSGASSGAILKNAGVAFAAGGPWSAIGTEQVGAGYYVALHNSVTDLYTVWTTNSSGAHLTNIVSGVAGTSAQLINMESVFSQDLNSNGHIGS